MFFKSILNLQKKNSEIDCYSELVTIVHSPDGVKIIFFPEKVILQKDGHYVEVIYDDLVNLSVSVEKELIRLNFCNIEFSYKSGMKSEEEVSFWRSVKEAFSDGMEDSPSYMQSESKMFLNNADNSSSISYLCKMMDENPGMVKTLLNKLNFGR